jgi:protein-tyrosine phosphatase
MMKKILFVCHGNICRSPMAEYVMKYLVEQAQLTDQFLIESAATSTEEIGNPVYPPARRKLAEHGISCNGHAARQMTRADYDYYDYLVAMEPYNIRNMLRITDDPEGKMRLLMSFAGSDEGIDDPWYTGRFAEVYRQIETGCRAMLETL